MKANQGTKCYYPEMGERKPIAEIEAKLSHNGTHYYLKTPLTLKGRGITYHDTYDESNCNNPNKYGWHIYYATQKAYDKLEQQYALSYELLLD